MRFDLLTAALCGLSCFGAIQTGMAQTNPAKSAKAGPPFSLRQRDGVWWLVSPKGARFFSMGVCCVTPGQTWLEYKPANPGYAAWKHYPTGDAWAEKTIDRLKSWGFTTIGGWGDYTTLERSPKMNMPITPVLHMGAAAGAPWWDMWDPKIVRAMDDVAKKQILAVRDDPRLLGYFSDNELGWWNAALLKMTFEHAPASKQRQLLIRLLRERYGSDWHRLERDFVPAGAKSFADLDRKGKLTLRPGGDGTRLVGRFIGLVAERYYALCSSIIRKYDRRGLYLGDRYQSFYYPEVASACRKYVDVVSTNLNANWNDGSLIRSYLDSLHALTGKPVLISEFYLTATENRSGDKNSSAGFALVPTQQERAEAFRRTVTSLLRFPYVVGADWFQYYDEPGLGRDDGENYNMGLVDIDDRPYEELTAVSASIERGRLHSAAPLRRLDATQGVPPAPLDPTAHWDRMEALREWDRERGFVPAETPAPQADIYLCWNEDAVYVGLYTADVVEDLFYKDKRVPEVDRMLWKLRVGNRTAPISVRLGGGAALKVSDARATVVDLFGKKGEVRNVAVAKLPAALFGKDKLRAGDRIAFTSTLLTQGRAQKMEWAGTFALSSSALSAVPSP